MKTLAVSEAAPGLARLVEMALAGEQIQIRQGDGVVELRASATPQAYPCWEPRLGRLTVGG